MGPILSPVGLLIRPGGGLSDGLKLSEQYVCVLRDVY